MAANQFQWLIIVSCGLLLGIRVVKGAVVNSGQTISPNTPTSTNFTLNTSLESAAESAWSIQPSTSPVSVETLQTAASALSGSNQSTTALDVTDVSAGVYRCDGGAFGYNLNVRSCFNTISASLLEWQDESPKTWGRRNDGNQYDFTLPRRYVSRDGTCIFEPLVGPRFTSSSTSQHDVALGAGQLVHSCADKNPSEGGLVKEIGDGKLGVLLAKQEPDVRCYGNAGVPAIVNSCQTVLDRMGIGTTLLRFGTGAGAEVQLPYTITAADNRCYMTLRSTGPTDSTAWSRIWEYGTAIMYMCAAQGKKGVWSSIGINGRFYLEVGALNPPADVATS